MQKRKPLIRENPCQGLYLYHLWYWAIIRISSLFHYLKIKFDFVHVDFCDCCSYRFANSVNSSTTLVLQKILWMSHSQGNSLHKPQNRTLWLLAHLCIGQPLDCVHSVQFPSDSIQPWQIPFSFFLHPMQHSPQAVICVKSITLFIVFSFYLKLFEWLQIQFL